MKYLITLFLIFACAKAPVVRPDITQCLDNRNKTLSARSMSPVTYDDDECNVIKGMWEDDFYPQFQTVAENLDVTYLVPLKHAEEVAPKSWSDKDRQALANDPDNLLVTDKKYAQKKGEKTIEKWLPPHKEYACKYIKQWLKVKKKYKLKVTKEEKKKAEETGCK